MSFKNIKNRKGDLYFPGNSPCTHKEKIRKFPMEFEFKTRFNILIHIGNDSETFSLYVTHI